MVIDANHSFLSPEQMIPSTPVSQSPCDSCFPEFPLLLPKLHTQVNQLHQSIYIFTFRAVRKIYPMEQVAVCAILFGKQELTACNTFSMLSSELSTTSQSSTGAHTERAAATQHHILYGGHWLAPSSGVSGFSTHWQDGYPVKYTSC